MNTQDKIQREILPIPDTPHVGLTTYDAKDPDTKYPPIEPGPTTYDKDGYWPGGYDPDHPPMCT